MQKSNFTNYKEGIRDCIPIALGYLAVSFSLGIAAKKVGITAFQATLMSFLNLTSAGEFSAVSAIAAGSTYLEIALMQFIINLRYMLMSCALSQKIDRRFTTRHRLIMGAGITDEIFGISVSRDVLNPFYTYGAMTVAIPGWSIGTCLGVIMGSVLPANVVSALSVALYGMFIAIIVPPARENKVIAVLVPASMAVSYAFTKLPYINEISTGTRIIILTVVISLVAAILFPVKEEGHEE